MFVSKARARGSDNVEWTLKIADFGLSRSINASQSRFVSIVGAGTETWMPPEGFKHNGHTSKTTYTFSYDVHPCGSLMYYILSGGLHAYAGNPTRFKEIC